MITWWDAHFREKKLPGILIKSMCINDEIHVPSGLKVSVIMVLKGYSVSLWGYFNSWLDQNYISITLIHVWWRLLLIIKMGGE